MKDDRGDHVEEAIHTVLARFACEFDRKIGPFADEVTSTDSPLAEAMRYSLLSPGKRLRPFLVSRSCLLVGGKESEADAPAAAIECVHAFSLIHDDLPAMDDDDLRRGRPTCHVHFDEATAILAGDGLLILAFEWIARHVADAASSRRMTLCLAEAAGWSGMVGGQAADMTAESQEAVGPEQVSSIHLRKTARLIQCACQLGAIAGGAGDEAEHALSLYGKHLGLAFQLADDLLDLTSTTEQLGKKVGKDRDAGKHTIHSIVGEEEARRMLEEHTSQAIAALSSYGPEGDELRRIAKFVARRQH